MARKAREEEDKPVGDNPDEWIAFANALRNNNQRLFNGIHWAADLIEAAAVYVKALRTHESFFGCIKPTISERVKCICHMYEPKAEFFERINRHDPFFGVTIFLFDTFRKGEAVPQDAVDVLCKAMECSYRELGKHYNLQEPAEKLAIDFHKLVEACQKLHKGKFGVYRIVRAELRFRHENYAFFREILNIDRGSSDESWVDDYVSKCKDVANGELLPIRDVALIQSGRHHKADDKYNVAVHVTHKVDSSFWDSVVESFGDIVKAAIHQSRAWRAKKPRPLPEPPKILARPYFPENVEDEAAKFADALTGWAVAKADVEKETPYYRGERKGKPKTPLSVQTSPKTNSQLASLNSLLNINYPAKPSLKFNEGLLALYMVAVGYFNALNDCARTPYLQMLTLTAKDNATRFFLFMGATAGLSNPQERQAATLKLNEYFLAFGASMDALAAGFSEFEKSLTAANMKKRKLTEKKAADMIGISTRQLRNWLKGVNRPIDFPGIGNELKLIEWLALSDDYGKEFFAEQRRKMKRGGSGRRIGYDENLKEHQDPDKSGRN